MTSNPLTSPDTPTDTNGHGSQAPRTSPPHVVGDTVQPPARGTT
jgi:hypothetical protein